MAAWASSAAGRVPADAHTLGITDVLLAYLALTADTARSGTTGWAWAVRESFKGAGLPLVGSLPAPRDAMVRHEAYHGSN
ncbi:hypothetical protein GCM10028832_02340 [Streptomyces sparsus]